MPATARLSDPTTGHGCFPPQSILTGSSNVLFNGLPAATVGDQAEVHCCGPVCHPSAIVAGSGTVFVNGKPLARVGDTFDCGSTVASGSPSINAG